jgi:release factor glutamine methyltransferase
VSVTVAQALAEGRKRLGRSATPALDARVLLEHVTRLDRASLIARDRELLTEEQVEALDAALARRTSGEPVAYITGRQEFFGREFKVGPEVLIPRPETEMLIDAALSAGASRILDLGTGSGCLLVTALAELRHARGVGIDRSRAALDVAEDNAARLGVADRADFVELSFADAIVGLGEEPFDLILANPPYISKGETLPDSVTHFEPHLALFSGEDGLEAHREVASVIAALLGENGSAFIEIGHDQAGTARAVYGERLQDRNVQTKKDGAGLARMVAVGPRARL